MQRGHSPLILLVLIAILAGIIGGAVLSFRNGLHFKQAKEEKAEVSAIPEATSPLVSSTPSPLLSPTASPSASPSPSPAPTVRARPATKKTSTPLPVVISDPCSKYKPSDGLTSVTVEVRPADVINENVTITLQPVGNCPAGYPTGYSSPIVYILKPGSSTTWNSPAFSPGQLRLNVEFKKIGQGFDIDGTSGNHTLIVDLRS